MTSFDWTGAGIVAAFLVFCVALTFAPAFRPSRRRFRISDRELRNFLKARAPDSPGCAARLLACCFRRNL